MEREDAPIASSEEGMLLTKENVARRRTNSFKQSPVLETASVASVASVVSGRLHIIKKGGLLASGFTLASATLGAGILALPSAMMHAGWAVGSLYVAFCGACCVYSLYLLVKAAERTGLNTWEELSRNLLGLWAEYLTVFFVSALCFGAAVGYVVVAGDVTDPFRDSDSTPEFLRGTKGRILCQSAFWLFFMLPLSLPKEVNALRYASILGVGASVYTTCLIVYHAIHHHIIADPKTSAPKNFHAVAASPAPTEHHKHNILAAVNNIKTLFAFSVILFGYGCQPNVYEVYHEMRKRSVFRLTLSSGLAMAMCSALYIAAGIAGYYEFGNNVESNILKNYRSEATSNGAVTLAYAAVAITVTMAFPVCIFPCRDAVLFCFMRVTVDEVPRWKRMLISAAFATACYGAGIGVKNLGDVLGLVGALCMSIIGFVYPALFVMRGPGGWTRAEVGFFHWIATWMMLVVGVIAAIGGTAISIYQFTSTK